MQTFFGILNGREFVFAFVGVVAGQNKFSADSMQISNVCVAPSIYEFWVRSRHHTQNVLSVFMHFYVPLASLCAKMRMRLKIIAQHLPPSSAEIYSMWQQTDFGLQWLGNILPDSLNQFQRWWVNGLGSHKCKSSSDNNSEKCIRKWWLSVHRQCELPFALATNQSFHFWETNSFY